MNTPLNDLFDKYALINNSTLHIHALRSGMTIIYFQADADPTDLQNIINGFIFGLSDYYQMQWRYQTNAESGQVNNPNDLYTALAISAPMLIVGTGKHIDDTVNEKQS